MYSVVMLMALSTGGDAVDCHHRGGCCGCYGGCYGGCRGCYGGCYGGCGGYSYGCSGYACSGYSYGCSGCYGYSCAGGAPVTVEKKEKDTDGDEGESSVSARRASAKLIVRVPAGAKLSINGTATKSVSAKRVFVSPTLKAGREYVYNLKAEVVQEGKTVVIEKNVRIKAGKTVNVKLQMPEVGVAKR